MRRVLLATAIALVAIASWRGYANAQDALPTGAQFVGQRVASDTTAILRLLDENAALRAEIVRLKAEAEKAAKKEPAP